MIPSIMVIVRVIPVIWIKWIIVIRIIIIWIIGAVIINLVVGHRINTGRRTGLVIRGCRLRVGDRSLHRVWFSRRRCGWHRHGPGFGLGQHGSQNLVGNSLLSQINDLIRVQTIAGRGIVNVGDDDVVGNLGLLKLQDLRDAVGQRRRRVRRRLLRDHRQGRQRQQRHGNDGWKGFFQVECFHMSTYSIEHPNLVRVARIVKSGRFFIGNGISCRELADVNSIAVTVEGRCGLKRRRFIRDFCRGFRLL